MNPQKCTFLFSSYFIYGIKHITDLGAYDHILFLLTISIAFRFWDWRKVVWSVTGFTLGHSISLGLAATKIISPNAAIIEFAIPITILISALYTAIKSSKKLLTSFSPFQFFAIAFFGIIHGLGFSGYLAMLLSGSDSVLVPLLAFNLGIELGQMIIVFCILALNTFAEQVFGIKKTNWILFWMGGAASLALLLIFENKFW